MSIEQQIARSNQWQGISGIVQRLSAILCAIARPSLTQLVSRFGLAVPFWRSGVNKWDGFLQLSDVATLLFSAEFKLHLPGGPYPFPAPEVVAFAAGTAEILTAHPPRSRPSDTAGRVGASGDDARCAAYRAGRLAGACDLGGNGAGHHGVGAGADFVRSLVGQCLWR